MPMYGKCPKCEKIVSRLDITTLGATVQGGKSFNAAAFLCPNCQTILGAGIDPVAVASDLGTRVLEGVHGATQRLGKKLNDIEARLISLG